jgi:NTP pyrophosphatase (non-canonical NTP hydrolase)
MWVARDKSGRLWLYDGYKPNRYKEGWRSQLASCREIDQSLFPSLRWEDEPIEANITPLNYLNTLSKDIHEECINKGFYEDHHEIGTRLMLVVSELSEALEADRKNRHATQHIIYGLNENFERDFSLRVKDTFEDEIADAIIRLLDIVGYLKIDIDNHIALKRRYNSLRPYKHNKNY